MQNQNTEQNKANKLSERAKEVSPAGRAKSTKKSQIKREKEHTTCENESDDDEVREPIGLKRCVQQQRKRKRKPLRKHSHTQNEKEQVKRERR